MANGYQSGETNLETQKYIERLNFFSIFRGPLKGRLIDTEDYTCPDCDGKLKLFITETEIGKEGFLACSKEVCEHKNEKLLEHAKKKKNLKAIQFIYAPSSIFSD